MGMPWVHPQTQNPKPKTLNPRNPRNPSNPRNPKVSCVVQCLPVGVHRETSLTLRSPEVAKVGGTVLWARSKGGETPKTLHQNP